MANSSAIGSNAWLYSTSANGIADLARSQNRSSIGSSDWLTNEFDPTYSEQKYNAYQAQIDRDFASSQAEITRKYNSVEAQKQRDFEERMSNTAYQRAAADMRSVGLNPYLAANSAFSASTPSGQAASSGNPSSTGARASSRSGAFTQLVSSALNFASKFFG